MEFHLVRIKTCIWDIEKKKHFAHETSHMIKKFTSSWKIINYEIATQDRRGDRIK